MTTTVFPPSTSEGLISRNAEVLTVSAAVAGTIYSFSLPYLCKGMELKSRGNAKLEIGFEPLLSNVWTVNRGCAFEKSLLAFSAGSVIYFKSSNNNDTVEVLLWS